MNWCAELTRPISAGFARLCSRARVAVVMVPIPHPRQAKAANTRAKDALVPAAKVTAAAADVRM